jgi:hypothetical protein
VLDLLKSFQYRSQKTDQWKTSKKTTNGTSIKRCWDSEAMAAKWKNYRRRFDEV